MAGQEARRAWGFMPAVDVWTSTDPWPGMPECPGSSTPATNCVDKTIGVYPGSPTSSLRYGEVAFTFHGCADVPPDRWSASVTKLITNRTASSMPFTIALKEASISVTDSGSGYVFWEGSITYATCRGWLICTAGKSPFKVKFYGYNDGGNPNVIMTGAEVPLSLTLFTTP